MGNDITLIGSNSFAMGNDVGTLGSNRFVIGSGFSSTFPLTNYISNNSLVVGFNSDIPTLYIGPSSGVGTTGDIGIGNSIPSAKLDVNGTFKVRDKSYLMKTVGINNLLPTKWLDIRGTYGKTIDLFENILQIGTNETTADPLLLQMGLKGDLLAANRYGTIEVMDGTDYKPLILQPNNGNVSIGLGTLPPTATLEVNGTFKATNTGTFSGGLNVSGTLTANTMSAYNLNVTNKIYAGGNSHFLTKLCVGSNSGTPAYDGHVTVFSPLNYAGLLHFAGAVGLQTLITNDAGWFGTRTDNPLYFLLMMDIVEQHQLILLP